MSSAETASTEKNNSNASLPQKQEQRKWLADVLVIVFCISGAAFSLNLFRLDLFQSIASQNKKPMGAVTVKYNNVQRRFSDRVLWSRLTVKSPVYLGDLIRVAEYSSATLNINDDVVDINENSLIRIRASSDGEGRIIIDLSSGSLSITGSGDVDSGGASGVALNVMGRIIAPTAGAILSASAKESGITLQVNEGSVIITDEDGQSRSMGAGEALILDTEGVEQAAPAAVVSLPRPNARFIKNSVEPVNVRFAWNVINIDPQKPLRLEIASGPNFTRIVRTAEGIDYSSIALGAGTWYWRLSYQDTVLSSGQFTIVDTVLSASVSPIQDSQFSYKENLPVRFEWQPIEEASYYVLEAGLTPDIINPLITRQTVVSSYVEMNMEAGNWYWHVKPVFSSLYEGAAAFSQVSSFRIEKLDKPAAVVQTTDTPPALQEQPEPEPILAAAPEPAKPTAPSASNTTTTASPKSNPEVIPEVIHEVIPEPVTHPASNTTTPESSISNSDVFISQTAGWKAYNDDRSKSNIRIAREIINGIEREVLTININIAEKGGGKSWDNYWAGASTTNENVLQKLRNANGVRFKVLGDGKNWNVNFITSDVKNSAYHIGSIPTKKGEVRNIDISFNGLRQPDWNNMKVKFNKNNLKDFAIERNMNNGAGGYGASTIKIFDFEVY